MYYRQEFKDARKLFFGTSGQCVKETWETRLKTKIQQLGKGFTHQIFQSAAGGQCFADRGWREG